MEDNRWKGLSMDRPRVGASKREVYMYELFKKKNDPKQVGRGLRMGLRDTARLARRVHLLRLVEPSTRKQDTKGERAGQTR